MKTAYSLFEKELGAIRDAGTWREERIITTPQRSRIDTTAARAQGVADACATALVPPPATFDIPGQRFDDWEPAIRGRIAEMVAGPTPPTGLVCSCDAVALHDGPGGVGCVLKPRLGKVRRAVGRIDKSHASMTSEDRFLPPLYYAPPRDTSREYKRECVMSDGEICPA